MKFHVKTPEDSPGGPTLCKTDNPDVLWFLYVGRGDYEEQKGRHIAEGHEICEHCDREAIKLKDEGPVYIHIHVNEMITAENRRTMVAHVLPTKMRDRYIIAETREQVAREWQGWKAGYPDVEQCEECFNLLTHALTTKKSVAKYQ